MRVYLLIYLLGCKKVENNQIGGQKSVKTDIIHNNCITQSDSLLVNNFVKEFIKEIEYSQEMLLSSKFTYPFHLFDITLKNEDDFTHEWGKSEKMKIYLTLDEYDENDNYLGKGIFQSDNIFYEKEIKSDDCYYVQYFIGDKVFIIKKKDGDLKIVQIDGVG